MVRHAFVDLETIATSNIDSVWDDTSLPSYAVRVHDDGKIELCPIVDNEEFSAQRRHRTAKRRLLPAGTPITIGRHQESHIWIPEYTTGGTFVSRHHGELLCERAGNTFAWAYRNLNRQNGTYVGDAWLRGEGITIRLEAKNVVLGIPKQQEPLTYALKIKLDLSNAF
jgi:pSer/pThr/pTyr-binding forkhead associated (FHA) protein